MQRPRDAEQGCPGTPGGPAQCPGGNGTGVAQSRAGPASRGPQMPRWGVQLVLKGSEELPKAFRQGQGPTCVSIGFLGSSVAGKG